MKSSRSPASESNPPAGGASPALPRRWRSPAVLPAIGFLLTGVIIGLDSFAALALIIFEGNFVAVILVAAALAGGWFAPLLGLGRENWRERAMVGAGLGIGSLSLIMLGLGAAGSLSREVSFAMIVLIMLAALLRVAFDLNRVLRWTDHARATANEAPTDAGAAAHTQHAAKPSPSPESPFRYEDLALTAMHYLWLLVCPFLAIAALGAVMPPGVLWSDEAGGYDALSYHLAVPKQWVEQGQIYFLPNNVYSNMPFNSEMLSLLMMTLRDDPIEAAFMAQLANVLLAALFVAAAWWTARLYSRRAGIVAGVLAASTPWVAYLASIAFVEVGMLAMGMLALGAMLRANQPGSRGKRWAIAAGLLAGLACGYKYTALPLIALPIGLLALFGKADWRQRASRLVLFGVFTLVTFSPWLIRNYVNTGNPVFPLAHSVFGANPNVWNAELNARWQAAHGWEGAGVPLDRFGLWVALQRTVLDFRFGIGLTLLALAGATRAFLARDHSLRYGQLGLILMLAVQVVIWLTATHVYARFAVVMLLPMTILAGRFIGQLESRATLGLGLAVLALSWAANLYPLSRLYYHHTRAQPDGEALAAFGHTDWFVQGDWPGYDYLQIVNALPPGSRVLFVGEARMFYVQTPRVYATAFSRHPLAAAVERIAGSGATRPATGPAEAAGELLSPTQASEVVDWLRGRNISHVLVNWAEMDRLRHTYGIDRELRPRLFADLQVAGLEWMGDFMLHEGRPPYATLYEVTNE